MYRVFVNNLLQHWKGDIALQLLLLCLQTTFLKCSYKYMSVDNGNSRSLFYRYNGQVYSTDTIMTQYMSEKHCIIECQMNDCIAIDLEIDGDEVKCNFFHESQTLTAAVGKWHLSTKRVSSGYCETYADICGICDCHNTVDSAIPYFCDCRPYQDSNYGPDCNETSFHPSPKQAYFTIKPTGEEQMDVFCKVSGNNTSIVAMTRHKTDSFDIEKMNDGFGLSNDYWIGVEKLHILTKHLPYTLVINILDHGSNHRIVEYRNFKIGNAPSYTVSYDKYIELEGTVWMIMENGNQLELCGDGGSYWWGGCVYSYNIFYSVYAYQPGIHYNKVVLTLRREPEVELLSENKTAYSSSVYNSAKIYQTENAFDGNFNQNVNAIGCYNSANEYKPELKVDLGAIYGIYSVKLYKRTDCCVSGFLTNAVIDTSNEIEFNDTRLCQQLPAVTYPIETFYCEANVKGRFVRIYDDKTTSLMICEMQVHGW